MTSPFSLLVFLRVLCGKRLQRRRREIIEPSASALGEVKQESSPVGAIQRNWVKFRKTEPSP